MSVGSTRLRLSFGVASEHGESRAVNRTIAELRVLREQINALTAQVEELADRVGGWEERQQEAEEAVHKALEMIMTKMSD